MALKVLMLRKKVDQKKAELAALRTKDAEFLTRETQLEQAIQEAQTQEEQETVEGSVEQFTKDQNGHENAKTVLTQDIDALEQEIKDIEAADAALQPPAKDERKRSIETMANRTTFFGMNYQERDAFLANGEVKSFLQRVRDARSENRSVTGAELLIPDTVLGVIREQIPIYSKLYAAVNVKKTKGTSRQNIMGTIPEGVWTEMRGKINELAIGFNNVKLDGFKVAGFIAIDNSTLEDSDLQLATEIIQAISKAIALALDKAIPYGKGIGMPMGFITRLAQTAKPSDYSDNEREWEDLHTSNIKTISGKTGHDLFKEIIKFTGAAKGKHSNGIKTWIMNGATFLNLQAEMLTTNAAGAIVTGQTKTMPIIGGTVVELEFMQDGDIAGGYCDLYTLVERASASMQSTNQLRFLEDQTVFKGTARYDGKPAIAEGFVLMNINGKAPATAVEFAADEANKPAEAAQTK